MAAHPSIAEPDPPRQGSTQRPTRRCPACAADYPLDFLVCPIDATALVLHGIAGGDPMLGEVLAGSFCITAVLGTGGMGRVYAAEHVRLPKVFAVKVPHEHFASHREAMARFEREAQTIARVGNEHVIEIVDVVRLKDGRPCMVTELLKGEELKAVVDRVGKLPLPTALTIARQVCRGLAAAHAAGIVHRDLKPSNLFLVRRDGGGVHVKILDFGVAKVVDGGDLTRTGSVVGTPAYMAPEQARGSANVDARADIYAAGAVLYRMVTGERPFPEDEPARTLARLLTEDPPRPRSIDRTIPEGIEALIQRAMARAPEDRPASAQELERLLAAFDLPEPSGASRVIGSLPARGEVAGVDAPATVVMPTPQAKDADEMTRRARRARPITALLAVAVSVVSGAAVLTGAAMIVRILHGTAARAPLGEGDRVIAVGSAGIAALLTLTAVLRVLIGRWRSVHAVERLGRGVAAALLFLFVSCGALGLAWRGYSALALPLPVTIVPIWGDWNGWLDVGVVALPTVAALVMLAVGLRRAAKVS